MKKISLPTIYVGKTVRIIGKIVYGLVFIVLITVASLVAFSTLKIPGNYKLLTVQSGSMEPMIRMGSVVLVKPENRYSEGDVITAVNPRNPKENVTHRVVSFEEINGNISYVTKGDANNVSDTEKRYQDQILGKVYVSVPLVGYVVSYAKTKNGFLLIVLLPTFLLIGNEIMSIQNEVKKQIKKRKRNHE